MKKIAAPIRVELAQYRDLAAFSQIGSDLDADTKEKLAQGERIKAVSYTHLFSSYAADSVKTVGSRGDEEAIARSLYRILREFDDEEVEVMYSESLSLIHI